ncbi:hypothetical protein YIM_28130 [Amycolatopsis sp. YIM 10]|nr:hypothetical protein YIM_28130 [Amycolatopsis sp. YIM 10]
MPPPQESMPPEPESAPPASTRKRAAPIKPVASPEPERGMDTEEKRRWGLTVVVLTLGAGAAVRSIARHR